MQMITLSEADPLSSLLQGVTVDTPVVLSDEGSARYIVLDIRAYEQMQATLQLMSELERGYQSGEDRGWYTLEEVENELGITCV